MELEKERVLCPNDGSAETVEAKEKHDGTHFCHKCGCFFDESDAPGKLVLQENQSFSKQVSEGDSV